MKKMNIHEAKTNLSKLIDLAIQGKEVTICKAGQPVAKLVPYQVNLKKRKAGAWKGKVKIEKDFDTLPEDFLEYFK